MSLFKVNRAITTFVSYSFQYVMTDEFYGKPFWFRLFYMMPMFVVFRTRLYIAWIFGEWMCMTATLGAYPKESEPKCGKGPTNLEKLDDWYGSSLLLDFY